MLAAASASNIILCLAKLSMIKIARLSILNMVPKLSQQYRLVSPIGQGQAIWIKAHWMARLWRRVVPLTVPQSFLRAPAAVSSS